jgi:cephalosporin hydroxylase
MIFLNTGVAFVGRDTMNLATALSTSSQQKKSQYVFFHKADIPPSPKTNACLELFRNLISKGERCIYVDTSLAELPPGIPTGDRIAKVWNLNVVPSKCCITELLLTSD